MVKLYYKSANGEIIDLRQFKTQIYQTNLHNYEWSPIGVVASIGTQITGFGKDAMTYELIVAIRGTDRRDILNHLTDITERDVVNKTAGRLYFGDWYIECFCISANTETTRDLPFTQRTWGVYAPYPFWIHDETKRFRPQGTDEGDYLDYDYDYGYDYSFDSSGVGSWNINHYAQSDFVMTIYGYAENPRILINGREYIVYTTINENEYVVIDTRNKLVLKYLASGDILNIFDLRGKESDVFAKLDAGLNTITWSGTFGFDITAFIERSEPKW